LQYYNGPFWNREWPLSVAGRAKGASTQIYVLGFAQYIKIGWTSNLERRLRDIEQGLPEVPTLLGTLAGTRRVERSLHIKFEEYRIRGEWFRREGRLAEWIDLGPDRWIRRLAPASPFHQAEGGAA
jgi:hypothetical protein